MSEEPNDELERESAAFYERLERMEISGDPAHRLVSSLWADVTDRRGWRQATDQFDYGIQNEILDRWLEIVRAAYP